MHEYWHIGATMIRFRSLRLRNWSGSNSRGPDWLVPTMDPMFRWTGTVNASPFEVRSP
jgi:hypothetical protein